MMWVVARISNARTRPPFNAIFWFELAGVLRWVFVSALYNFLHGNCPNKIGTESQVFDVALLLCGCWGTLVVDRESERAFVFSTTFQIGIIKVLPRMKEIAPSFNYNRNLNPLQGSSFTHPLWKNSVVPSVLVMNEMFNLRAFDSIPQVSMCSSSHLFGANRHPKKAQLWHNSTHVCLDPKCMQSAWLSCIVMKYTTAAEGRWERIFSAYSLHLPWFH